MRLWLGLLSCILLYSADLNIRGFPQESLPSERNWETKARGAVEAQAIRQYLEHMAARPHLAGTPASRAVAEYIAGLVRSWGWNARIEEFDVLLPVPTQRSLEMVAPRRMRATLREPAVPEDADTAESGQIPTYNAFSAAGDVTAPLVYVNYGMPEDYEYLRAQGVDLKGKIAIARYGGGWRGEKPTLAAAHGAVGCLLYSDPRDDGYYAGDTFPRGPFRPAEGVQRGSVLDLAYAPGDPLTPGWAAEKGAKRLPRSEAPGIQKIPVLPISWADARPLLRAMRGPVAPEPWRGALPITYHIGPGPAKVRLHVEFDWSVRPIYDVIAEIRGSQFPDEWVIYGNHHDAWVNGASDPASGGSALLETARVLGELTGQGWRPKRTLLVAFWDGEEFGLMGSTEWSEKHAAELTRNAVAYLNSDSSGRGKLAAGGSPILEDFIAQVGRDVADPGGQQVWQKDTRLAALGAGSDYTPFLHHLGVASLHLGFQNTAALGSYHSIYDDVYWYEHFSDGTFVYERALAQLMTTALIRLADAPIVPFQAGAVAERAVESIAEMEKMDRGHRVAWAGLRVEVDRLKRAAAGYDARYARALGRVQSLGADRLAAVNEKLFRLERAMAPEPGLPGRPWYRHRIYAPGVHNGYGAVMLPGIREAVDRQDWEEANRQARELAEVMRNVTREVWEAARGLE
jgi:N-acetylated-alpha-linked acidic dipeptidase